MRLILALIFLAGEEGVGARDSDSEFNVVGLPAVVDHSQRGVQCQWIESADVDTAEVFLIVTPIHEEAAVIRVLPHAQLLLQIRTPLL